jgi:hypothetical protein
MTLLHDLAFAAFGTIGIVVGAGCDTRRRHPGPAIGMRLGVFK